jgi:hypothetical protein
VGAVKLSLMLVAELMVFVNLLCDWMWLHIL